MEEGKEKSWEVSAFINKKTRDLRSCSSPGSDFKFYHDLDGTENMERFGSLKKKINKTRVTVMVPVLWKAALFTETH